ncbi:MAG: hypothetical protein JXM71_04695 [Spirochaetales bacterium]|nr:hypothetical protein [Spirochaetales bacterium]
MPHVIHYEDDIFIADDLVRVVADAASLEPDPEVLGDMVLAITRIADSTLRRVKDLVLQNDHLVERPEYLRLLARSTLALAEALSDMLRPGAPLSASMASSSDELERIAMAQRAASAELRDVLGGTSGEDSRAEDLVSGDELSGLLGSEPSPTQAQKR